MLMGCMNDDVASPRLANKNCCVDCQSIEQFTQITSHSVKVVTIVGFVAASMPPKVDSNTAMAFGGKN
jgi:hypothetical protein